MIIDTFKSLRWIDFFLYAVLEPRMLYKIIKENEPKHFALSFVVPAFVSFNLIVTLSLLGRGETDFFYYKITYLWILLLLVFLVNILVASALIDLLAQFLGYKGNVREIISLFNFSFVPFSLMVPLLSIFAIFNFAPWFFFMFFSLCFSVWAAIIASLGISEMHSISMGKAALLFFFPLILIGTTAFFIMNIIFISLMFYMAG